MSVTYEDNNNKEFTNSSHVEGRRKPTATVYIYILYMYIIYLIFCIYTYIYFFRDSTNFCGNSATLSRNSVTLSGNSATKDAKE